MEKGNSTLYSMTVTANTFLCIIIDWSVYDYLHSWHYNDITKVVGQWITSLVIQCHLTTPHSNTRWMRGIVGQAWASVTWIVHIDFRTTLHARVGLAQARPNYPIEWWNASWLCMSLQLCGGCISHLFNQTNIIVLACTTFLVSMRLSHTSYDCLTWTYYWSPNNLLEGLKTTLYTK